jgi:hypothetical protein
MDKLSAEKQDVLTFKMLQLLTETNIKRIREDAQIL